MKLYWTIISAIVLPLLLIAGCSEPIDTTAPASASGWTDADGQTTLSLGTITVNATVQDISQRGLPNVLVSAYLGHNNILLTAYDTTGIYYPSIALPNVSALSKTEAPSHINSPEITDSTVPVTLVLYGVEQGGRGFGEPAGFDDMVSDEWTIEQWHSGELPDIYRAMDTLATYNLGAFIHLSQEVAQTAGAPFRTAVFLPGEIENYPVFSCLVGLVFNLFDGDTFHFAQLTYSDALMPIMHIDNVVMHRDFWMEFTLVWGENPQDLDSHLWTPLIGPDSVRYHVYWYSRGAINELPFDTLDVDDLNSWGPEHITMYQGFHGTYTYAVYHYSGSGTIASSGAAVTVFKPNGTFQTFKAPTDTAGVGSNWWWHVCTIDGSTGVVTPINLLSSEPPYPDVLMNQPIKK